MSWPILLLICALIAGWAVHANWLYRRLDWADRSPVTHLLTRLPFMREAKRMLRRPDPVVVFIDLDEFKAVNDLSSHEAGDLVLRAVATRLRAHFGSRAALGQLYGDEFGVVTRMTPRAMQASLLGLNAMIAEPITVPSATRGEPHTVRVTASIGAVHAGALPRPDLSAVLHQADLLMYEAKEAGRNCARVYVASARDSWLEHRLPRAPRMGRSGSRAGWRRDQRAGKKAGAA